MGYTVEELREFLRRGRDWERLPVKGVDGVFIVKVPATGGQPAHLAIEIEGLGVLITSREDLEVLRREYAERIEKIRRRLESLLDLNGDSNPTTRA